MRTSVQAALVWMLATLASPSSYAVSPACIATQLRGGGQTSDVSVDPLPKWAKKAASKKITPERMKEVIQEINGGLIGGLKAPDEIGITVVKPFDPRADSFKEFKIFLRWPPKDQQDFEAKLSHEYGHAIFDRNLAEVSKAWKAWNALNPAQKEATSMAARPPGFYQLGPYEELFADTVAVVRGRDPKAMSNSLGPHAAGRDFSGAPSVRPMNAADFYKMAPANDPHHALDPVRGFLWNQYLSKAGNQSRYGEIVEILYKVSVEDLFEQAKIAELPVIKGNWREDFNLRLIKKLKKALKDFE